MSEKHLSKTRFDSFPFSAAIMAGIRDAGFDYCTPIQAQTLPLAVGALVEIDCIARRPSR